MFTGIVEEIGRITSIEQSGENRRITIAATNTPRELKPGDSVAVSGVCLTAVDIKPGSSKKQGRSVPISRPKPGCALRFHAFTKGRS